MPEIPAFFPLILLGTWAALDSTAVGQFMISRPLVSATLAGALLGDSSTGLLVGLILEAAHLGDLPAGGARVADPGPAGVVGAAAAIALGGAGGLALGAGVGIGWSQLGALSVGWQRRLNALLVAMPSSGRWDPVRLSARHWACIGSDAVRGAALTGTGIILVTQLPMSVGARWPLGVSATVALLVFPGVLLCGDLLRTWGTKGGKALLLGVGGLVGILIGLVA